MSNKHNDPVQGSNDPVQGSNNPGKKHNDTMVVMLRTVDMGKTVPSPLGSPLPRDTELARNSLVIGRVYRLSPQLVNVNELIGAGLAREAKKADILAAEAEKLKSEGE